MLYIVQSTKNIYQQEIEFSLGQFTMTMMVRLCGYILVINESFYGEYGCQAVNELGVASKSLQVSGEEMSVSLSFAGSTEQYLEKFVNLLGSELASLA